MTRRGFTLVELVASLALLAAMVAIAARVLVVADRAAARVGWGAAWETLALVAVAEDVREARVVRVYPDRLVIERPGRLPAVWRGDGSGLARLVAGRRERFIAVRASFGLAGRGVRVTLGGCSAVVVPRAGRVVGGAKR